MTTSFQPHTAFVARVLLSVIFLLSGVMKVTNWSGTLAMMEQHGITLGTPVLLAGAIAAELLGGVALLMGFQTRFAAGFLVLYLIPVSLTMHAFWGLPGPEQQQQMFHFLKNVAIIGGLLEVAAVGAPAMSLDAWLAKPRWSIGHYWRGAARPM